MVGFGFFFEPDKKYTAQNSGYHAPLTDLYAGQNINIPINMEEIVATELSFISVFLSIKKSFETFIIAENTVK